MNSSVHLGDLGRYVPRPRIRTVVAAAPQVYCDCAAFFASLPDARERVLLIDYDGTIAPFTVNRKDATPYRSVPGQLERIIGECATRVVLITGRSAREVPPLLGIDPHPELWGTHGMERLTVDGHYSVSQLGEQSLQALNAAALWGEEHGVSDLLERKPGAVALHWRGYAPDFVEHIREIAYQAFAPLACRANLRLCEFDGGLELCARSCDKGHAVRSVLAEVDDAAVVAYLGDDLSDEDAFRALSGRGFSVLVRPQYRPTTADAWLRPPDDLLRFLSEWITLCGGRA